MTLRHRLDPTDKHSVNFHRDERGVILNWLGKLVVGLAIFGTILFDVATIAVNFFGLDSTADDLAIAISTEIQGGGQATPGVMKCRRGGRSPIPFCQTAFEEARKHGARLLRAEVTPDEILHIRLRREAETLLVRRIGFMKSWGIATAEGQASAG